MKPLVPIALIVTGGALIVAPMVHHLLLSDLIADLLAKSQPASVDLPAFERPIWYASVIAGVVMGGCGIHIGYRM
jgi:hypothetical protein